MSTILSRNTIESYSMEIEVKQKHTRDEVNRYFRKCILENELFADIFYMLSTLDQFHKLGFCDKMTKVPEGTEVIFLEMRDNGYELLDGDLESMAEFSSSWTPEEKKRVLTYYNAYHNMRWDMENRCWTQKS